MSEKILIINPGSTSTKIAMYDADKQLWAESIEHPLEELNKYDTINDQLDMRYNLVIETVNKKGDDFDDLATVVSRGGPFAAVKSGAYEVDEAMLKIARDNPINQHASNVGMAIAKKIADSLNLKAYIYDAVTVDEVVPVCRIVGWKDMDRHGQGHNLNMRAAAINTCLKNGWKYREKNIIVAHLGGGITLSLHSGGQIIDMISDDEGPFSPERAGGLPNFQLMNLCYSEEYDKKGIFKRFQRAGGLVDHLGTPDARKVEKMIEDGDTYAALVYDAMALAVAKNIAKLTVLVEGKIDAIVLTGGIAFSKKFTSMIVPRINFLAPVEILPGENEMEALAQGGLRILRGVEKAHIFSDEKAFTRKGLVTT
jgi:butyrate kinase